MTVVIVFHYKCTNTWPKTTAKPPTDVPT